MPLRLRSGGLHADGLTDLELCEDLISVDSPVSAHAHGERKLTVCQLAISIKARHTSWPIMCFYTGSKKGSMVRTCHFCLSSKTKGAAVGLQIHTNCYTSGTEGWQPHLPVLHLWACGHCTHLANSCCVLGDGSWGVVKNDCQQPQWNNFLHHPSKSSPASSQIKHITLKNVSTLMGCLSVWATNQQR